MEPGFLKPGNNCQPRHIANLCETSMEPGFLKPGNNCQPRHIANLCETSMEPGFLKPGNLPAGTPGAGLRGPTSMEPGFLKPGNIGRQAREPTNCFILQWSQAS